MKSSQFHIEKENQAKLVNKTLQTVKSNNFSKVTREVVTELANQMMSRIDNMRMEVYHQLQNVEYKPEKYDHQNDFFVNDRVIVENSKIEGLRSAMIDELTLAASDVKRTSAENIIGDNFATLKKSDLFIIDQVNLEKEFTAMAQIISLSPTLEEAESVVTEGLMTGNENQTNDEEVKTSESPVIEGEGGPFASEITETPKSPAANS